MLEFTVSLSLFILAHTVPEPSGIRSRLIDRFGKKNYIIGYSILSTGLLIWLIWSALRAPYIGLWFPTPMTALAPVILMLPVCLLFSTAILRANPISLAFVQKPFYYGTDITSLIRHPLLLALFLWAIGHTIANGDLVGVIMFGGLAAFSLVGMSIMQRRAKRNLSANEFQTAMAKTDGPFLNRLVSLASLTLLLELSAGIFLYISLLHLHEPVIGVDPLTVLFP